VITIKKLSKLLLIIPLFLLFVKPTLVSAAQPTFSLYPKGGTVVNKNNGFVVDIIIDSAAEKLTSAKFTLLFDPEILQLKKAERNNTLFSQFPEDESSLDNENGVVLLTGFTQSGANTLYQTSEKPDVFARLTFNVLKEGEAILDWEYGGTSTTFNTLMLKDGSPPQNILNTKPESATFTIGNVILDPSTVNTSVPIDKYILVTGAVLILFGAFMVFTKPSSFRKKSGTVVVYDEE
jgi:hypothetical protein